MFIYEHAKLKFLVYTPELGLMSWADHPTTLTPRIIRPELDLKAYKLANNFFFFFLDSNVYY